MSKTEELLKLAEAAHAKGCETEMHLGYDGKVAGSYVVQIRNDTLKQLIELVRLQHFALSAHSAPYLNHEDEYAEAIAAYERFEKGEG